MDCNECLKINAPQVVHETIDGETILLNLDRGIYYSMNDTGALLWALIENNGRKNIIIEQMIGLFEGDANQLATLIKSFFDELLHEGLVISCDPCDETPPNGQNQFIPSDSSEGDRVFEAPLLHKYTDMQDLLLLDPIHDVDDDGWPVAKPN